MSESRAGVRKTYKLFIGGAFPRSESGRSFEVTDHAGGFLANAALASRKDGRNAVAAARAARGGWASATAYNRGQVLYRVAEVMEGRRAQFVDEVASAEGLSSEDAGAVVDATVDLWVHWAGWTDKLAQVAGAANPVAGPFFNLSVPEPTGVVVVMAPQDSSLLGLTALLAPVLTAGCTAVVVASHARPLPAITLAEVLATSDVPGGVVNVLTGDPAETAPRLASHGDVDGIDLAGARDLTSPTWGELEAAAAETLTRVRRPAVDEPDWAVVDGPGAALAWCETKTVWHPKGT